MKDLILFIIFVLYGMWGSSIVSLWILHSESFFIEESEFKKKLANDMFFAFLGLAILASCFLTYYSMGWGIHVY